jgi:hypothetical protein
LEVRSGAENRHAWYLEKLIDRNEKTVAVNIHLSCRGHSKAFITFVQNDVLVPEAYLTLHHNDIVSHSTAGSYLRQECGLDGRTTPLLTSTGDKMNSTISGELSSVTRDISFSAGRS